MYVYKIQDSNEKKKIFVFLKLAYLGKYNYLWLHKLFRK